MNDDDLLIKGEDDDVIDEELIDAKKKPIDPLDDPESIDDLADEEEEEIEPFDDIDPI
jgi:hypothetical protein